MSRTFANRFRVDARVVAATLFILASILIGVVLLTRPHAPAVLDAPAVAAPEAVAAASQGPAAIEPLPSQVPSSSSLPGRPVRDGIVPIVSGQPEYAAARRQLDWFEAEVRALRGGVSHGSWDLAVRIYNSEEFENLALRPMINAELAALRAWGYGDREFAEELTARASRYVR